MRLTPHSNNTLLRLLFQPFISRLCQQVFYNLLDKITYFSNNQQAKYNIFYCFEQIFLFIAHQIMIAARDSAVSQV